MRTVFDASAILAVLNEEKGYEIAESKLESAALSLVNFMEVVTYIARRASRKNLRKIVDPFERYIVQTDYEMAYLAGELGASTQQQGLSLGDRACLALAMRNDWPVLTADRIWSQLDLGIPIEVIR